MAGSLAAVGRTKTVRSTLRFAARAGPGMSEEGPYRGIHSIGDTYAPRFSLHCNRRGWRRRRCVRRLVPLISQMNPDASTIAAGAPIEVDLTPVAEGQVIKVFWRGKPIFVNHRTKKEIEEAARRQSRQPAGPAARLGAREAGQGSVAGADRHLHPSRLHPARAFGPVQRLFLPVPRLGLRHLGPHPLAARRRLNLALPPYEFVCRHQDQDRLTPSSLRF